MKLVKCKSSNRFLIKDEWYEVLLEVISTNDVDNGGYYQLLQGSKPGRTIHYELVNHTHKRWNTSWYHETNFYTLDEIREEKINILLKDNLF